MTQRATAPTKVKAVVGVVQLKPHESSEVPSLKKRGMKKKKKKLLLLCQKSPTMMAAGGLGILGFYHFVTISH